MSKPERKFIKAPSGDTVEIKEDKGSLYIVYQLDENNNRIKEWYPRGEFYVTGIVTKQKPISNQTSIFDIIE
jgi:hypothetical protein